jgi:hypothetical protein
VHSNGEDFAFLRVRRASLEDTAAIEALRSDAESRPALILAGQWQFDAERREVGKKSRLAQIRLGNLWIVESRSSVPMASFCVDGSLDPEFWNENERVDALTLHGTVVGSWASGLGIGSSIHDFAGHLARAQRKPWLRLDAWKTNSALHRIYTDDGFDHVRTVNLPHRQSGALFQRPSLLSRGVGPALVEADSPVVGRTTMPRQSSIGL